MNKLLLLNGSHSEIKIIKEAKEMGYYVYTIGNNPEAIGHKQANKYINRDYKDLEFLVPFCIQEDIKNIIPAANDFSIEAFLYLKKRLNLKAFDSIENLKIIHQKNLFKQKCRELDIYTPKDFKKDNVELPIIVKPVDNFGGKGITKVYEIEKLEKAVNYALENSSVKKIVLEELISGPLFSLSTYLKDNKVVYYYDDIEFTKKTDFSVTLSSHPSGNNHKTIEYLKNSIEKISHHLSLCDGVFHIQYLVKNNLPYIIEATRRLSGDLYQLPLEYSLGVNWSRLYLNSFLDIENIIKRPTSKNMSTGRMCLLAPENGTLKEICINDKLNSLIIERIDVIKTGGLITNYKTQRVCILHLDLSKIASVEIEHLEDEYKVIVDGP